jgi:hypothetical protein
LASNLDKNSWQTSGPLFEESLKPQIMLVRHDPNEYSKMLKIKKNARVQKIESRRRQLKRLNPGFDDAE